MLLFLTGCGKEKNTIKVTEDAKNTVETESYVNKDDINSEENNNNTKEDSKISNNEVNKNQNKETKQNSNTNQSSNNIASDKINSNNNENKNNNEPSDNYNKNDSIIPDNSNSNNVENDNSSNNITYSNEDKVVINTIEDIDNNVDNLLKEGTTEDVKNKAKGVFITLVDFVFYDGEINGITFDELTNNGKQKVLELINKIDNKIEKHIPDYKETISDKTSKAFAKASEVIKNGANNIKNFAKEKLGEEYYQEIIDDKDEFIFYTKNAVSIVGKVGSSLFNNAKDKLSSWYENFKNNN